MSESPPAKTEQQKPQESPEIKPADEKSPTKNDVDKKKQRKKKEKALKEFLQATKESQIIDLPRKAEEEPTEQSSEPTNCKICGDLSEKKKQCDFCKDSVCLTHIRKKRKHKETNKFVRICDDCEDKFLQDKYLKLETKAEEAMVMQEMIVEGKNNELAELVASKQTKIIVMRSKKKQLQDEKKEYDHKIRIAQNDMNAKEKRFEHKLIELKAMEEELKLLEERLPRPLDDDYNCLVDQNSKINKQLVKFEKLCGEALKAKSTREKELYDAYYKWEKKEVVKATVAKKEDCRIY